MADNSSDWRTFLVLWETEKDVPTRNQDHVIPEIFSLDLGLLHHNNVGLEGVKHGLKMVSLAGLSRQKRREAVPGKYGSHAMADTRMGSVCH